MDTQCLRLGRRRPCGGGGRGAGPTSAKAKFDNLFTSPEETVAPVEEEAVAPVEDAPAQEITEVQDADPSAAPTQEEMLEEVESLEHTIGHLIPQEEMLTKVVGVDVVEIPVTSLEDEPKAHPTPEKAPETEHSASE